MVLVEGDNIGIVSKGANYGWKDIAWGGTEYYGEKNWR